MAQFNSKIEINTNTPPSVEKPLKRSVNGLGIGNFSKDKIKELMSEDKIFWVEHQWSKDGGYYEWEWKFAKYMEDRKNEQYVYVPQAKEPIRYVYDKNDLYADGAMARQIEYKSLSFDDFKLGE